MTEATLNPRFEAYMRQEMVRPYGEAWTAQTISEDSVTLGAGSVTDQEAAARRACYMSKYRAYHRDTHGEDVGQPYVRPELAGLLMDSEYCEGITVDEAKALLGEYGHGHDAVYMNVDYDGKNRESAWPEDVRERIGDVADFDIIEGEDGKPRIFMVRLKDEGRQDDVTRMVAEVFGFDEERREDPGLIHNRGGNEFASALYMAKCAEATARREGKPIPWRTILAGVTMTAATIPFRSAKRSDAYQYPDGYMGRLRERALGISLPDDGSRLSHKHLNAVMLLSVEMANRDTSPFMLHDNAPGFIHGGRMVKKEEVKRLREGVELIGELGEAADVMASAPSLYGSLSSGGNVKPEDVPHFCALYDADGQLIYEDLPDGSGRLLVTYPPADVYQSAVENTKKNAELATQFFKSHRAGILTARALAVLVGEPNAKVKEFVDSNLWDLEVDESELERSQPDVFKVYRIMRHGDGQEEIDSATSPKSPIGGTLLASMGSENMDSLSHYIQSVYDRDKSNRDPFADPGTAREFLQEVAKRLGGPEQLRPIIDQLVGVAEAKGFVDRIEKLRSVPQQLAS